MSGGERRFICGSASRPGFGQRTFFVWLRLSWALLRRGRSLQIFARSLCEEKRRQRGNVGGCGGGARIVLPSPLRTPLQ